MLRSLEICYNRLNSKVPTLVPCSTCHDCYHQGICGPHEKLVHCYGFGWHCYLLYPLAKSRPYATACSIPSGTSPGLPHFLYNMLPVGRLDLQQGNHLCGRRHYDIDRLGHQHLIKSRGILNQWSSWEPPYTIIRDREKYLDLICLITQTKCYVFGSHHQ